MGLRLRLTCSRSHGNTKTTTTTTTSDSFEAHHSSAFSLVRLGPGDRNFHILYQICAGLSPQEKQDLKMSNAESYHYLNQSEVFTIQGRSEAEEFKITRAAMDTMGISSREQESIFRVVAAILHLGNVVFQSDKKDGATTSEATAQDLETASDLLKVAAPALLSGQPNIFFFFFFFSECFRLYPLSISLFSLFFQLSPRAKSSREASISRRH